MSAAADSQLVLRALAEMETSGYSSEITEATRGCRAAIESGKTVTEALREQHALAWPAAVSLFAAGEFSGTLEFVSFTAADCLELREVTRDVELTYWCRTLSAMLASGVGVLSALEAAAEVVQSAGLRHATRAMIDVIRKRGHVGDAVRRYPDVFPPFAQAALSASQEAGAFDQTLQWLAEDPDPAVRRAAMGALSDLGGEAAAGAIVGRFGDTDTSVRQAALRAAARLKLASASQAIADIIADPDQRTASTAIRALEEIGEFGPLTAWAERALRDENTQVRLRGAHILRYRGTPDHVPALIAALDDESSTVRFISALALGSLGCTEAADRIEGLMPSACCEDEKRMLKEVVEELRLRVIDWCFCRASLSRVL